MHRGATLNTAAWEVMTALGYVVPATQLDWKMELLLLLSWEDFFSCKWLFMGSLRVICFDPIHSLSSSQQHLTLLTNLMSFSLKKDTPHPQDQFVLPKDYWMCGLPFRMWLTYWGLHSEKTTAPSPAANHCQQLLAKGGISCPAPSPSWAWVCSCYCSCCGPMCATDLLCPEGSMSL